MITDLEVPGRLDLVVHVPNVGVADAHFDCAADIHGRGQHAVTANALLTRSPVLHTRPAKQEECVSEAAWTRSRRTTHLELLEVDGDGRAVWGAGSVQNDGFGGLVGHGADGKGVMSSSGVWERETQAAHIYTQHRSRRCSL